MKKSLLLLAFAFMLSLTCVTSGFAASAVATTENTAAANARLEQIKARVEEIKHMDKSQLTREERKELRHELKGMRKEAKTISGGVYLSVGAILIIILVLILIL